MSFYIVQEEVVLLGQVFAEQLLDGGNQWSGRTSEVDGHIQSIDRISAN
jgi:hypothetical protein